jgi:hypothetical protein
VPADAGDTEVGWGGVAWWKKARRESKGPGSPIIIPLEFFLLTIAPSLHEILGIEMFESQLRDGAEVFDVGGDER